MRAEIARFIGKCGISKSTNPPAGIRAKAREGYIAPDEESQILPNEVQGCWTASKPVEIVVSDMTMFKAGKKYWEWTILLDTFNNQRQHAVLGCKSPVQYRTEPGFP